VIYQLVRFYILLKINNLQKGFLKRNEAKSRAKMRFIGEFEEMDGYARASLLALRKNLHRNHFPPDCIVTAKAWAPNANAVL
jgi:hypothetical protein